MSTKKEERKDETTITTSTSASPSQSQLREHQQQAINRALDETKDNIRKTTDEARSQIPRYTRSVNDYQEQTIHAAREIADNYLDSQRELLTHSNQHVSLRLKTQTKYFGQIGCLQ